MRHRLVWLSTVALLAVASPGLAQQALAPPPPAQAAKDKPADNTVQGLTVTGQSAQQPVRTDIDRRSYSVSGDLQAGSGSIGDALRNVPSVEVDVQGNLSLRGDANVTIMIDGKPSGMFKGASRATALQSLPAERIDRVEVITNPSAAFDADGSAGIINLITKRGVGAGRSGSVRANLGEAGRRNGGATIAYNSKRLSLNADLALRHDVQKVERFDRRTSVDPATSAAIDSLDTSHGRGAADLVTLHGGLDYEFDKTTHLTFELNHNDISFGSAALEEFDLGPTGGPLSPTSIRQGKFRYSYVNDAVSAGYRKTLPGDDHSLTLDLNYDDTALNNGRPFTYLLGPPTAAGAFENNVQRNDLEHAQLKAEYKTPLPGEARLTLGYQLQYDDNSYDNRGERGPNPGAGVVDPALTGRFLYEQTVNSMYGTHQRPIGKLTVLAGLRLEEVRVRTDQVILGRKDGDDYLRAYPSLHLAYDLGDNQQVTAAYSHRVQRPNPQDLDPLPFYQDAFNFRAGNPNLKPQQTDSYELAYQYKKSQTIYLATLYYRDNRDSVTDVLHDLGGGVLLTTKENLGSSRAAGLELVANGRITPKLTYNINGTLYWNQIDAAGLGFPSDRSGTAAQGRANLNWQVTPKDFVQVNSFMTGRRLTPQGYRDGWASVNLGYRHKFNDKVAGTVTLQDAFDTLRFRTRTDTPQLKERIDQTSSFRALSVGLTYVFGDGKKRPRDPGFDFGGGAGPTP